MCAPVDNATQTAVKTAALNSRRSAAARAVQAGGGVMAAPSSHWSDGPPTAGRAERAPRRVSREADGARGSAWAALRLHRCARCSHPPNERYHVPDMLTDLAARQ
ncbi:hypothetical protein Scani_75810 [Streptomyces caniferus]|uniref:Uncharacterized protein n=1 Tax=Streptomyces caniferus TaxID=285557 RepID=A0A640SIE5_9ACTN|nr:hypothetical protein Scani_75810 [Streptomyces caniferus]